MQKIGGDRHRARHANQRHAACGAPAPAVSRRVMPPVSISGTRCRPASSRGQLEKIRLALPRCAVRGSARHRRALIAAAGELDQIDAERLEHRDHPAPRPSASNPPRWKSAEFSFTATANDEDTASRIARTTSSSSRARFSKHPPHSSLRWFTERREELRDQIAMGGMDLDTIEPGALGEARGRREALHGRARSAPGSSPPADRSACCAFQARSQPAKAPTPTPGISAGPAGRDD